MRKIILLTFVTLDGVMQHGTYVPLVDDHKEHAVEVKFSSGEEGGRTAPDALLIEQNPVVG